MTERKMSIPVTNGRLLISDLIRVLAETGSNLGPANSDNLPQGSSNLYSPFYPTAYGSTTDYTFPGTIRVNGIVSGGSTDVSQHTIINVPDDQPGLVINQNLGPVVMDVNYAGNSILTLGPGGLTLGVGLDGVTSITGSDPIQIRPSIATGRAYVDTAVEIGDGTNATLLLEGAGSTIQATCLNDLATLNAQGLTLAVQLTGDHGGSLSMNIVEKQARLGVNEDIILNSDGQTSSSIVVKTKQDSGLARIDVESDSTSLGLIHQLNFINVNAAEEVVSLSLFNGTNGNTVGISAGNVTQLFMNDAFGVTLNGWTSTMNLTNRQGIRSFNVIHDVASSTMTLADSLETRITSFCVPNQASVNIQNSTGFVNTYAQPEQVTGIEMNNYGGGSFSAITNGPVVTTSVNGDLLLSTDGDTNAFLNISSHASTGNISLSVNGPTTSIVANGPTTQLTVGTLNFISDSEGQTLKVGDSDPTIVTIGEGTSAQVTINGDLTATNNVALGTNFGPATIVKAPLIAEQGFLVNGTLTYLNTEIVQAKDGLIILGVKQPADMIDLGFAGQYSNGASYSGMFRQHGTDQWRLFTTAQDLSETNIVNIGAIQNYDDLQLRNLTATGFGSTNSQGLILTSNLNANGKTFFGVTEIGNIEGQTMIVSTDMTMGEGTTLYFNEAQGNTIGNPSGSLVLSSNVNAQQFNLTNLKQIGNNSTTPLQLTSVLNVQGNTILNLGTISAQGGTLYLQSDLNLLNNNLKDVASIGASGANSLFVNSDLDLTQHNITNVQTISGGGPETVLNIGNSDGVFQLISPLDAQGNYLLNVGEIGNVLGGQMVLSSNLNANGKTFFGVTEIGNIAGQTMIVSTDMTMQAGRTLNFNTAQGTTIGNPAGELIISSDVNAGGKVFTGVNTIGNSFGQTMLVSTDMTMQAGRTLNFNTAQGTTIGNPVGALVLSSNLNANGKTFTGVTEIGNNAGQTMLIATNMTMGPGQTFAFNTASGQTITGTGHGGTLMIPVPKSTYVPGGGTVNLSSLGANGTLDYYFGQVMKTINDGFNTLSQNLQTYFTGSPSGGFNFPAFGPSSTPLPPPGGNFSSLNQYLQTYP